MNRILSKTITLVGYFALALATAYSIFWVFSGIDFRDSFYYACKFLYSDEVDAFFPLTHFLFRCCSRLFGDYLIAYRFCNWFFFYLSSLLGYFFVRSIDKNFSKYGLWILSIAIVLTTNVNTNVFSGESISAFFLIGSFVSLYKATHSSRWWLIALSFSVSLCALTQFPNIVLVPILLLLAWLFCSKKNDYWYIVLSIVVACVLYVIIGGIIFGGLKVFVNNIMNAFANQTNIDSAADHSLGALIIGYLKSLKGIISDIKYVSLICIIPLLTFLTTKRLNRYFIIIAFLVLQVVFVKMRVPIISDLFNYFILVYAYSIIFVSVFSMLVVGLLRRDKEIAGSGLIPLCIAMCSPAGSDSGFCLLGCSLFAFLPWLFFSFNQMIKTLTRRNLTFLMLSLVGLSLSSFIYTRSGMSIIGVALLLAVLLAIWCTHYLKVGRKWMRNGEFNVGSNSIMIGYFIIALMTVGFTIYAKSTISAELIAPKHYTGRYKAEQLKYMRSSPEFCQFVDDVMNEYYDLTNEGKSVVFFGNKSFVFCYLSKLGAVPGIEFTQSDISRNIDELERLILENRVIVFLCPDSPRQHDYRLVDYPKTIKMLEGHGYECEPKGNGLYAIYHPAETIHE